MLGTRYHLPPLRGYLIVDIKLSLSSGPSVLFFLAQPNKSYAVGYWHAAGSADCLALIFSGY